MSEQISGWRQSQMQAEQRAIDALDTALEWSRHDGSREDKVSWLIEADLFARMADWCERKAREDDGDDRAA